MRPIRFRHLSCVKSWTFIFCCVLLLGSCLQARPQVAGTGSIQGTIQDPSGAVIPNALVSLANASTAVVRSVRSDGSGLYNFPNIDIGTYTIDVTPQVFELPKDRCRPGGWQQHRSQCA